MLRDRCRLLAAPMEESRDDSHGEGEGSPSTSFTALGEGDRFPGEPGGDEPEAFFATLVWARVKT